MELKRKLYFRKGVTGKFCIFLENNNVFYECRSNNAYQAKEEARAFLSSFPSSYYLLIDEVEDFCVELSGDCVKFDDEIQLEFNFINPL